MWKQSLFAGILIGLGSAGFLALGGIPGAVIFAFGLIGVVLSGVPLYTGKAGVLTDIRELAGIWFWNVVGCVLVGLLLKFSGGDYSTTANTIVIGRLQMNAVQCLLRAIGCGMIIDISVWVYRFKGSILLVLFGVPLFIVCGFYHSIADVAYITASWNWTPALLWYYPVIVIGNYLGCNVRRLIIPNI